MNFKAVLFDLDGTLLDTIEDLSDSMNIVLQRSGFPVHDIESYKYFIGSGIKNLVRNALPENNRDEATIDNCLSEMRIEYGKHWSVKTHPYDGIPQLLDLLVKNGIRMSILSNKVDNLTKLITSSLLPNWKFEVVFGERPSIPKKPDPTAALEISEIMGLLPEDFIYLGDSGIDMQTANSAGMYAAGALWGFRKADELVSYGAKTLIKKPTDLIKLL